MAENLLSGQTAIDADRLGYAFAWRFSLAIVVGYLLATVPQVILDPRLKSNLDSVREYHFAYMIVPIAIFVFFATLIGALFLNLRHRLTTLLPFTVGCILSVPIFRPVPHGNLLFIGVVWLLIATITVWVGGYPLVNSTDHLEAVSNQARIEFIKEQIAFWKGLGAALLAAFLGALITLVQSLKAASTQYLSSRADQLLMGRYVDQAVGLLAIFMVFGPLYEIARKVLATTRLLLDIRQEQ